MIQKPSTWDLIKSGFFHEASENADREYNQTQDIFQLRNKLYALLLLKNYRSALELSHIIIDLTGEQSDIDQIILGIIYWILGEETTALNVWQKATTTKYTDAAGGIEALILIIFAAIKLNNEDLKKDTLKKIKQILKSNRSINYPAILGKFLIGEVNRSELLMAASSNQILRDRQMCGMRFVLALDHLTVNDSQKYKEELYHIVTLDNKCYLEPLYYLAVEEYLI